MKFISIVGILVAVALAAMFVIKDSDALLLAAIVAVIAGFFVAVFQIPKEEE